MLKVIKPMLDVKIDGAARAWPAGDAVTNLEIFRHHPESIGKSEDLLAKLSERVFRAYGFRQRYLTRKPWLTADPAREETSESLVHRALEEATTGRAAPEAFILGTTTSRRYTGSQAASVAGRLGWEVPAYEIKAGCSTSLASLHLAQSLLCQGYKSVAVGCGETLSKVMHPEERETWFGLADGAAAITLRQAKRGDFTILKSAYSTDGRLVDLYTTPADLPPSQAALAAHGYALVGDGARLRKHALTRYGELVDKILPTKRDRNRVRWIIPHQVNRGLAMEVIQSKGLGGEVLWDAEEFGNIGGASVLFTLARAWNQKRFAKGDLVYFMSVGGGLSFAGQLWRKN